jgi:Cof subfamily protein (haloacid dehalogenase superfamily)
MNIPEFKTLPRAVAIDLDGTLLNSRTELSERNCQALERCLERGIPIIIATSRPARIFDRIFPQNLTQKCSYILMNGALAKGNPPLTGYIKENLPYETLRGIIDCALKEDPHVRITLEIEGYEFGTNWHWDPTTLWQRNSATPEMVLTLEEALKRNPCKIALGNTDVPKMEKCLTQQFGERVSIIAAYLTNPILNITTKNATKPSAIRELLEPLGISLSEVLAFGDDTPDIDMLKECGISVAMANAFPEVKAVCKYQTTSNDEDGVALVLEKMLEQIQVKS